MWGSLRNITDTKQAWDMRINLWPLTCSRKWAKASKVNFSKQVFDKTCSVVSPDLWPQFGNMFGFCLGQVFKASEFQESEWITVYFSKWKPLNNKLLNLWTDGHVLKMTMGHKSLRCFWGIHVRNLNSVNLRDLRGFFFRKWSHFKTEKDVFISQICESEKGWTLLKPKHSVNLKKSPKTHDF